MTGQSLASLPMYDLPELQAATDAWWDGLAQAFRREGLSNIPARLSREGQFGAEWRNPALLFSQCCGMDFVTHGQAHLRLLATPVYATDDCNGPDYCSLIVVRVDDPAQALADLRARRAAVNMPGSHSGYNALRYLVASLLQSDDASQVRPFFSQVLDSGSHAASLQLLQTDQADCAAIDCVTFALLARHRPAAIHGLRVLTRSPQVPGLPYVCSNTCTEDTVQRLRNGLFAALNAPHLADARAELLLQDAVILSPDAYQPIQQMMVHAQRAGYIELS